MKVARTPAPAVLALALMLEGVAACGAFGEAAGGSPDAGASEGGSSGSSGSSGQPGGRFCAGVTAKKCFDFDGPGDDVSPFTLSSVSVEGVGAAVAVDATAFRSGPRSLLAKTPSGGSAEVVLALGAPPSALSVGAAVRLEDLNAAGVSSSHVITIRCARSTESAIYVKIGGTRKLGFNQVNNDAVDVGLSHEATLHKWLRLSVDLAPSAVGGYLASFAIDDVVFVSKLQTAPLACDASGLEVRLGSNLSGGATTGNWVVRLDDVVVDWTPAP